jgi:hypothetical protein
MKTHNHDAVIHIGVQGGWKTLGLEGSRAYHDIRSLLRPNVIALLEGVVKQLG